MNRFTRLYLELDATNATSEKIALIESYLRAAPPADAAWAVALFTGHRPKGSPSTRALRELMARESGFPPWMLAECHEAVGDWSETISLILPASRGASDETLQHTMEQRALRIAGSGDAERAALIADAWRSLGAEDRFVFHKVLRGGFRVGVQRRTLARAIAAVSGVALEIVLARLAGGVRPTAAWYENLIDPDGAEGALDQPYPFYLAHQLDREPADLGDIAAWAIEWKWDGVRAQLVRRGNVARLWSRGEDLIDDQFPEVIAAARGLPVDCVLDGELVMWSGQGVRPFAELQTRLGRTSATSSQLPLFEDRWVAFLVFDALERSGDDLRARPWTERRAALEALVGSDERHITPAPLTPAESWDQTAALRDTSRDRGVEGLMLKRRDAPYGVGRVKGDGGAAWWKWKVDPYTADAVLVAAQPGSGRRSGLFTDLTFAVWEADGDGRRLTTFAKAYSGLSNDEIEELDAWIRRHTTGRAGPVRFVEPAHVFELAFEGIGASGRHSSGLAVRFPRIARWRRDKPAADADTLETLRSLLRGPGPPAR